MSTLPRRAPVALLGLSLLLVGAGARQDPAPAPDRAAAMQRFEEWIGTWSGTGWSLDAAGQRTEFNLEERVQPRAGGTVLLLEGHGTSREDAEKVTHDGLVLLYFDEHTRAWRWNGHEARAGTVDAEAQVFDGGLQWSLPAGEATVRFTIHLGDGHWRETGEVSRDGKEWNRFMELELVRTGR
jgi:hypothetical protein